LFAKPVVADLIILAIDTPHIAITEKYSPGAFAAGKDRFFAVVVADGRYQRQSCRMAESFFAFEPIDAALSGT